MRELPSGTVTFLFTDVERSTQTVAALGDERYADVQDAHRKAIRDAFRAHDGAEVGTEGDAFFVAFTRARDAVDAAIEAQRALADHQLSVRMGLHTGEALVRNDDYIGHDVHKAKRVCEAGHGGQILTSGSTAELVRGTVDLIDLGTHRLKDLGEPQRLFQVAAPGLDERFPPLRTLDSAPHNLPLQLTTFVGRERELEEVAELLAKHRLLTLTGVGGCGKTRLAIHAAAVEVDRSRDGVFFCDLSRLADEDGLATAVAGALGLEITAERAVSLPPDEGVRTFLARRNALLVLDNCEHLIGAVAELAEDLLTSCPDLRILATSREALDVPGEHIWPIPSLDATAEAVQLFVERAEAVRAGFELTDNNRADVEAVCTRLDGIPLAIELAAAQTGHLSPRQIAERLDQRFMTLTGGRRRVQRQQTLQAAMDWSWDLLDEHDQRLLRRLSVFQAGCTLEAAEAVSGHDVDVVSGLRSLVTKSLVIASDIQGEVRYRLLETVRLYAEDKQAESGESDDTRNRHRDHILAWLESIPDERTLWGEIFTSELLPEEDNVRAALRWSQAQDRVDLIGRILVPTRRLWLYRFAEAPRWFELVLSTDLPDELRGRLLVVSIVANGALAAEQNLVALNEAMNLLGTQPDPWTTFARGGASTIGFLSALITRDDSLAQRSIELADEAVEYGRAVGPFWEGTARQARSQILLMQSRLPEAAEECARICRLIPPGGPVDVPYVTIDAMRAVRHILGDGLTNEQKRLFRDAASRRSSAYVSPVNASVALERSDSGDSPGAEAFLRELLTFSRDRAPWGSFSVPFTYAAAIAGSRGDIERAARLLAAAMKPGIIFMSGAYAVYRYWVPRVREALGSEHARRLREEGSEMTTDEVIDYILEGIS